MNKVICWFSCGITSAVACKLAVEKYGAENCDLVYINIESSHPDNERFILDCEQWIGKSVIKIQSHKFKDHFEVIQKVRFTNSPFGAPCTKHLKKNVRLKYEKDNPFDHQVFGFEFERSEINRAIRFKQQNPHTKPVYPLIERKLTKNECAYIIGKAGIEMPEMYKLGFSNNNCIGCVKGGPYYWNQIRKHFPDHFPDHFELMSGIEQGIGHSNIQGLFLKDLKESHGRKNEKVSADCGIFCEIDFADLLDPLTEKVLTGEKQI